MHIVRKQLTAESRFFLYEVVSEVKQTSRLGYIYSQTLFLDTSVTWSVALTQTTQSANDIVWDANDIFMRYLYGHIQIELKQ